MNKVEFVFVNCPLFDRQSSGEAKKCCSVPEYVSCPRQHYLCKQFIKRRNIDLHVYSEIHKKLSLQASKQKFIYKVKRKIILPNAIWPLQNLCPDGNAGSMGKSPVTQLHSFASQQGGLSYLFLPSVPIERQIKMERGAAAEAAAHQLWGCKLHPTLQ